MGIAKESFNFILNNFAFICVYFDWHCSGVCNNTWKFNWFSWLNKTDFLVWLVNPDDNSNFSVALTSFDYTAFLLHHANMSESSTNVFKSNLCFCKTEKGVLGFSLKYGLPQKYGLHIHLAFQEIWTFFLAT